MSDPEAEYVTNSFDVSVRYSKCNASNPYYPIGFVVPFADEQHANTLATTLAYSTEPMEISVIKTTKRVFPMREHAKANGDKQ